jgi:hypothetical protein
VLKHAEKERQGVAVETDTGAARFPSLTAWLHTDIGGWTLADKIDDEQFALFQREAAGALARFVGADGRVQFPIPAQIATARRP